MRHCISILLAVALFGCDRQGPAPGTDRLDAPSGQGTFVVDGEQRTLLRTLGVITYGDTVEGTLPPASVLAGWAFVGSAGDTPTLATTGTDLVALYGPRDAQGLWGTPRLVARGNPLQIDDFTLPSSGEWLILLRGRQAAPYTLTLTCPSCTPPVCAAIEPCDLACPEGGYAVDTAGCRRCACAADTQCDPACADGERCVDGVCTAPSCVEQCPPAVQPVCGADRRTYRNTCVAECAGVEVLRPMACPSTCRPDHADEDCPAQHQCVGGRCVPDDCGCAPEGPPVCTTAGRTERNRCFAECRGQQVAYEGECVARPCDDRSDCPAGSACLVAPRPGNAEACRDDPDGPNCIRECRPRRCTAHAHCDADQRCHFAADAGYGTCTDRCPLAASTCAEPLVCVPVDDALADEGLCLVPCEPGRDARCPPGSACAALDDGGACLPCARGTPGCGQADTACARCPVDGPAVCGDDGQVYLNACDAQCHGAQPAGLDACGLEAVEFDCVRDTDCAPTGCGEQLCAAAPTALCPDRSPAATCSARLGACGCTQGRCGFALTREAAACIQRTRRGL